MKKVEILSPLPGTFYRRSSPESTPFKDDGDAVEVGDILGLVEVMKNFHEIKSQVSATNIKFLIEDSSPVEPGQLIAELDK